MFHELHPVAVQYKVLETLALAERARESSASDAIIITYLRIAMHPQTQFSKLVNVG